MSTGDHSRNDLATLLAYLDGRFNQMTAEIGQLKKEMKTEASQLNHRMDVLTEIVEQGRQMQHPVDGGGEGLVNQDRVDGALNNVGDGTQDGQEDDQQDAVSVKSEIDSGSCQSDCDYWLKGEDIEVKEEEVDEDSGLGGQQQQDQAPFQPVAGPSGTSSGGQKRPQVNPLRRSTRLTGSQRRLNLVESSDTSDSDEDETDSAPSPPTKKARTTTSNGSKRRRCPHCSKMVTHLSDHLRTHTGERRHVCDQCPKAFTEKGNLTAHRRIHTGERPFVCQHANCDRAFAQKTNLTDHLRRHSNEKRHHCEQCGRRFVASRDLTNHRRRMH